MSNNLNLHNLCVFTLALKISIYISGWILRCWFLWYGVNYMLLLLFLKIADLTNMNQKWHALYVGAISTITHCYILTSHMVEIYLRQCLTLYITYLCIVCNCFFSLNAEMLVLLELQKKVWGYILRSCIITP